MLPENSVRDLATETAETAGRPDMSELPDKTKSESVSPAARPTLADVKETYPLHHADLSDHSDEEVWYF